MHLSGHCCSPYQTRPGPVDRMRLSHQNLRLRRLQQPRPDPKQQRQDVSVCRLDLALLRLNNGRKWTISQESKRRADPHHDMSHSYPLPVIPPQILENYLLGSASGTQASICRDLLAGGRAPLHRVASRNVRQLPSSASDDVRSKRQPLARGALGLTKLARQAGAHAAARVFGGALRTATATAILVGSPGPHALQVLLETLHAGAQSWHRPYKPLGHLVAQRMWDLDFF